MSAERRATQVGIHHRAPYLSTPLLPTAAHRHFCPPPLLHTATVSTQTQQRTVVYYGAVLTGGQLQDRATLLPGHQVIGD